jgi:putative Holliday junction resolvase
MDGSESELSRLARKFARRLQGRFNIEVLMVDERLTSQDAKSTLREAGLDRQSGRIDLTKIDHLAAALILQSWLDQPALGQAP